MRILITGADGFIGRVLVTRLLEAGELPGLGDSRRELVLLDRQFTSRLTDARLRYVAADIADPAVWHDAMRDGIDCVFHLASVPGGAAEANFPLGLKVNLEATVRLLESARQQGRVARIVFASTIGVYGAPLPPVVDEATLPEPTLSYGAHKLVGEILITDYSRHGHIDGRCLRLPGIVARPLQGSGLLSAFLSELIRKLWAGEPFVCPVAADGMSWWMSRPCVVQNLLHAAALRPEQLHDRRVWLLPVIHASMAEVVAAIARLRGTHVLKLVSYQPDPALQAQFADYPPLRCPTSEAAGFWHDGTLEMLVQRALEGS